MTQSSDTPSLAIPGVVHVAKGVVQLGGAAGWITTGGIKEWSQELSLIVRSDLSDAMREELGLTLPEHRIAPRTHPLAHRAAQSMKVVGVMSDFAPKLIEKGVRVHTVGFDRVTGGFLYFAKGGSGENLEIHGDLLEMIAPTLEAGASSNEDIEKHLDKFIDRVLVHFSGGLLDETKVELANALPRLASDARGMQGVDLDGFEAEAAANEVRGKQHEESAKKLASALDGANGTPVEVPLFGAATKITQPAMDVMVAGKKSSLPSRTLWVVSGEPKETEAKLPVAATVLGLGVVPASASPKPAAVEAKSPKPAAVEAKSPRPAAVEAKSPKPAQLEAKAKTPKPVEVEAKPAEVKPIVPTPVLSVGALVDPKPEPILTPEPIELKKPEAKVDEPKKKVDEPKKKVDEPKKKVDEPKKKADERKKKADERKKKADEPKKKVDGKRAEAKPTADDKAKPKEDRAIEKKPAAAPEPAPKSNNTMLLVIVALLLIAGIAYFMMKKH